MFNPSTLALLNSSRVDGIMQGIQDPRLLPFEFRWDNRVPDVPSSDAEITAKYNSQFLIADIIADDAEGVIYNSGRLEFQTASIVNLKMGMSMNQSTLAMLQAIQENGGIKGDNLGLFNNTQGRMVIAVKTGVRIRKEVLKLAMLLDGVSYDKLGIKIPSSTTFGMYSDLKVTPSVGWGTAGSATPLTDIRTVRRVALQRYGINLNRATMSYAAFVAMVATTEFLNQAKLFGFGMFSGIPAPALPLQDNGTLLTMAQRMLGGELGEFTIEIDDRRYYSQALDGSISNGRIHAIDKVLLTNTAFDGNSSAFDFANCVVTESIVGNVVQGGIIGEIGAPRRGPIAYTALANTNLNPPGYNVWGVARGFPRKHMSQASAVLSVGTLSETIATTLPDPM